MKSIVILSALIVVVSASLGVHSQTAGTSRQERAANARVENDLERRMQDMRALEDYARRRSEKDRKELESLNPPELDKKAKERIRQMRMLDKEDVEHYRSFLAGEKTGIFRIFPNFDCLSMSLVRIDGECARFVPESSDFSFRAVAYTNRLYHDIGFERDELVTDAFFSQGLIATLGDIPIENVTDATPGLKFLVDLKPDPTAEAAKRNAKLFDKGIDSNGIRYSTAVLPVLSTTYAVRVIAYRLANSVPGVSPNSTLTELKFKSLEMDTRDDIIVAFRVIRVSQDAGLTIVWKELARRDSPKIKFDKGEAMVDFK
jgi:hypothetical protein